MARSSRPTSESYLSGRRPPVGPSPSPCSGPGAGGDEDDHAPIFSLSKSSMDVVMATDPPHKRDPAWTRLDLRRSSSTNTHSDQNPATLQQQQLHHHQHHPHRWRHGSRQPSLTTHNQDPLSPPPLSERWLANTHRWSAHSGGAHSRSSTLDTVVWKGGGASLPGGPGPEVPDSPLSRLTSPPTTPSPFISPFGTPTLPPVNLLTSCSSPFTLSSGDSPEPSPHTLAAGSPEQLSFRFPSPVLSPISLADAGVFSDSECFVDSTVTPNHFEDEVAKSPLDTSNCLKSPAEGQEPPSCHLVLPPTGRGGRPPLVTSLSDSRLGGRCRCSPNTWEGAADARRVELLREEATMTSQVGMVDAAVQTASPLGSSSDLRGNVSTSTSVLGSPPGSRLNLKSPLGSHSNLVSASSSMFPVSSSGEEEEKRGDDPEWDSSSASSRELERKRSCLRIQADEKDELGRRSSMKQVQWDEDGLTWEIHGASLDPEELSMAIKKHLELKSKSQPLSCPWKNKKAPRPPVLSNLVTTMAPDMSPPAMGIRCIVEGESEDTPEAETATEPQRGAGETTERENKRDSEKICGEHVLNSPTPSADGTESSRKKTMIRSLRRPRWCGGSGKTDD